MKDTMKDESRTSVSALITEIAEKFLENNQKLCTVESCTGGMIAQQLTAISGSSAWFEYGFVTYSNEAKTALVGVEKATLANFGAVSEEVVKAMALGGLTKSEADYAISVSGIAGPTGAVPGKPVGTVCIGIAYKGNGTPQDLKNDGTVKTYTFHFNGTRESVRAQACNKSLQLLLASL